MNFEALQNIHKPHYEKATNLLTGYLLDLLNQKPDQTLNILEIGPGSISVLLQGIVNCSQEMKTNGTKSIDICFIDQPVPKYQEIKSRDGQLYFLTDTKEFKGAGYSGVINLKASLIRSPFDDHSSEYPGGAFDAFSKKKFDFIVMHSVLHELFIASKIASDRYFPTLFQKLHGMLKDDGILFFGDPYYPPYHGTLQSYSFVNDMAKAAEHANAPVAFLHPEYLLALLLKSNEQNNKLGFKLLADEEMYINYNEKGRKFYLIVLQKAGVAK